MPGLVRFFGLIITMYWNDHPPPHFHVRYGSQHALIDIQTLSIITGSLSPRALGLVIEWAALYRAELLANWERARARQPLEPIAPLE
jgi:hypothetical protein